MPTAIENLCKELLSRTTTRREFLIIAGKAMVAGAGASGLGQLLSGCAKNESEQPQEDIPAINKQIQAILAPKGLDGAHNVYWVDPTLGVKGGYIEIGNRSVKTKNSLTICWSPSQYSSETPEAGQEFLEATFVQNDVDVVVNPDFKPGQYAVDFNFTENIFEGYNGRAKKAIEEATSFDGIRYEMFAYASEYVTLTVSPQELERFKVFAKQKKPATEATSRSSFPFTL
jgi:hypothetical protein